MDLKPKDLKQKGNMIFFELFSLYTKQVIN